MTTCTSRAAWLNLLRRLHFYIGLFIGPFIFVAALTGTLYVATPQLENWLYHDALSATPGGGEAAAECPNSGCGGANSGKSSPAGGAPGHGRRRDHAGDVR
ncbi:Uncharacterized iron-regulated membrane protein [Raoultella terrigena]|nr:Uncharacterized iron-regulated membrane protein [Raoultella terrigena]